MKQGNNIPSDAEIQKEKDTIRHYWGDGEDSVTQQKKALFEQEVKKANDGRKVFKEVQPEGNNFPNIPTPDRKDLVDIDKIADRYQKIAQQKNNVDVVYAFASFSMPKASIIKLIEDTKKVGGVVVFRGFVDGSYPKTSQIIYGLGVRDASSLQINPKAFKTYKVTKVPSYVLVHAAEGEKLDTEGCALPEIFSKVTGDVTLEYALEEMEKKEQALFKGMASRLLLKLRGQ